LKRKNNLFLFLFILFIIPVSAFQGVVLNEIAELDDIGDVSVAGASSGQILVFNATSGLWVAGSVNGSGTVTSITRGYGFNLSGTPITSAGTIDINSSVIQNRVTGTCTTSEAIRVIAQDGSVTCVSLSAGAGDITSVQGNDGYIINGSTSGDVYLVLNITKISELGNSLGWNSTFNATYAANQANNSWNQSYATTLFSPIIWNYNQTTAAINDINSRFYNRTQTDTILSGNITSLNSSLDVRFANVNSSNDITDARISCLNISGGSDADFCADTTGAGGGNPFDQILNTSSNVSFGNIIPVTNNTYDLGNSTRYWNELYVNILQVITQLTDSQISNDISANYTDLVDRPANIDTDSTNDLLITDLPLTNRVVSSILNITGVDDNACGVGDFVNNVTFNNGVLLITCGTPSGSGDITSVLGDSYITNGSLSGAVNLVFNQTRNNATIDARASVFNETSYVQTNFVPYSSATTNVNLNAKNITNIAIAQAVFINGTGNYTTSGRYCLNQACSSYIWNNGSDSIWL